ncbi:MAG: hypothetical protein IV086_07785 [Hyphomonadaceae bacterium]|nr:hypothetical protein [Hyphomonadaceae bacterium]
MSDVRRVLRFCVAVVLGGLVAKAFQTVIIIVSSDLTGVARTLAIPAGFAIAAMFGAAAATLISQRKGFRASCVVAGLALASFALEQGKAISPGFFAATAILVALGAWLGHVRFRR